MRLLLIIFACLSIAFPAQAVTEGWAAYEDLLKSYGEDPKRMQQWEEHMEKFPKLEPSKENHLFECDIQNSNQVPTSVNKLRPGDIKVVGAIGDSISAGFGLRAVGIFEMLIQNRGNVFSIGGVDSYSGGVITIPNILKKYNSEVYGFSTGDGGVDDDTAKFNVAIGASLVSHLPEQVDMIIQRMKGDSKVNFEKDWKMVTLFIGGNDLCRVCVHEELKPTEFLKHMTTTLDKLAAGLPRAIINVIPIMDVTPLPGVSADELCDALQAVFCPCAVDTQQHEKVKKAQAEFSSLTSNLIRSGKYDRDDFTVVFQPYPRDALPPKHDNGTNDLSYFAPDCFHFSEKGHKSFARNLWNSLFVPVGQKPTSLTFKEPIQCPPKDAYIKTNKNSKSVVEEESNTNKLFADVMAARPEHPNTPVGGFKKWLAIGMGVVGTIGGVVLIAVLGALKRKQIAQKVTPYELS